MAADEMGIQRMCEEFVKDYEASFERLSVLIFSIKINNSYIYIPLGKNTTEWMALGPLQFCILVYFLAPWEGVEPCNLYKSEVSFPGMKSCSRATCTLYNDSAQPLVVNFGNHQWVHYKMKNQSL